jgi:hypothetical protein
MNKSAIAYFFLCILLIVPANAISNDLRKPVSKSARVRIKILFLGNSLTYTNNLPGLITEIGKQENVDVTYRCFAKPGYSIEDHLSEGKFQRELAKGRYDFVVAQQGPSAMDASRKSLVASARQLKILCDAAKTQLAFLTVWPSRERITDLDNVIISYRTASETTNSINCPAGLAWKKAWELDSAIALYGPDGLHPSLTGSLLCAVTIYKTLALGNNLRFIEKKSSWSKEVGTAQMARLVEAAEFACQKPGRGV